MLGSQSNLADSILNFGMILRGIIPQARPRRPLRHHFRLLLEFFCLEVRDQSVDDWLELAVHHI